MVTVTLVCGGGTPMQPNGSVIVNGTVIAGDTCPVLTQWEASPLQVESGAQIDVSATATDADMGQTLTYAWTATTGTFATAIFPGVTSGASVATKYSCGAPGPQTLAVTVTDSYQPTGCSSQMIFPITCITPSNCGDGIVEPGEQCDPPNGTSCNSACQQVAFCGDGIITPPENCEPPGSPLPTGGICPPSCIASECIGMSSTCTVCEMSDTVDCLATLDIVPRGTGCWGCDGFPPGSAARADCQALYTCIRTSNCMNGDMANPCLCGALDNAQCEAQGPPAIAACATQYANAAADTASIGSVFQQFGDPNSPVGIANNLAACAVDSAANPAFACSCP
jgi:hypothetical protein